MHTVKFDESKYGKQISAAIYFDILLKRGEDVDFFRKDNLILADDFMLKNGDQIDLVSGVGA